MTTTSYYTREWARNSLNQDNPGLGVEYHCTPNSGFAAGFSMAAGGLFGAISGCTRAEALGRRAAGNPQRAGVRHQPSRRTEHGPKRRMHRSAARGAAGLMCRARYQGQGIGVWRRRQQPSQCRPWRQGYGAMRPRRQGSALQAYAGRFAVVAPPVLTSPPEAARDFLRLSGSLRSASVTPAPAGRAARGPKGPVMPLAAPHALRAPA